MQGSHWGECVVRKREFVCWCMCLHKCVSVLNSPNSASLFTLPFIPVWLCLHEDKFLLEETVFMSA